MPETRYDYLLLKADGSQECMHRTDRPLSLEEMQAAVGGYVNFAPLSIDEDPQEVLTLVVNEEGMLRELPPNHRATALAGAQLVGDAILTTRKIIAETPFRHDDSTTTEEENDHGNV